MEIFRTARFYQIASDEDLEEFEAKLDAGDSVGASELVTRFFREACPQPAFEVQAKKEPGYLEEPPKVGDVVLIVSTGHYAKLLAISDDQEIALVREEWGSFPTKFDNIRRVR